MAILFDSDLEARLKVEFQNSESSVVILSAFLKATTLRWLKAHIDPVVRVTIVSRWQMHDLICGASDLIAYEFARDNGWTFAINTNMHHKIYLIDNRTLIIGSANFTSKGLHLGLKGNDESSIQITPSKIDLVKLNRYVLNCCTMDDVIFNKMKEVANIEHIPETKKCWPLAINGLLKPDVNQLWVNDLLFNSPNTIQNGQSDFIAHDLILFGLTDVDVIKEKEEFLTCFRGLAIWNWLLHTVKQSDSEFVRFGEVTAQLHTALVDDPKPYRKDVKMFLCNLYEWIRYLDPPEIGIMKFNRSEALFLKNRLTNS